MQDRDMPAAGGEKTGDLRFWYTAAERFGFAAITLVAVMYVARVDLIQPLVRSHDQLVSEVIRNAHEQGEMIRAQTAILNEVRALVAEKRSEDATPEPTPSRTRPPGSASPSDP